MHISTSILFGIGAIATAFAMLTGWLGFPHMVKNRIRREARLEPGSQVFEMWSGETKVPVYLKFYFFNVTNGDEVAEGAKPSVVQVGPYTYLQKKIKYDIKNGTINGTVHYRQQTWLYFQPNMSRGLENELVTSVNVPLVSIGRMLTDLTPEPQIHGMVIGNLAQAGEKLFKTASIRELLFDGVALDAYTRLIHSLGGNIKAPKAFESGKFAFYEGKNGSNNFFDIESGKYAWKKFGRIHRYNNKGRMTWWKTDECNHLRGTDGTIYAPLLTHESRLESFSPELCRVTAVEYNREVPFKGFTLFRFTTAPEVAQGTRTNPKNECYCYERRPELCRRDGLIMVSGCFDGAPVSYSAPHFYGGDPSLSEAINGLDPDEDKHKTFLDIEPWTAVIFRAAKRLQLNIDVEQIKSMSLFAQVTPMAMPIMWVEESVVVPDDFLPIFKQLYWLFTALNIGKWVMLGVALSLIMLAICCLFCRKEKDEVFIRK